MYFKTKTTLCLVQQLYYKVEYVADNYGCMYTVNAKSVKKYI